MKVCRFETAEGPRSGRVVDGRIVELVRFGLQIETSPFVGLSIADARMLAPVAPSKIVCVGRNYREHASELGHEVPPEPLLFFKPPSSLIGPGQEIMLPPSSLTQRVDYEGELGVVIGRRCRNVRESEDWVGYVRGYTCVNDVTARDLQKKDGQWARAKGFDTFCPVGPWLVTSDELEPSALEVITRLNGVVKQRGNTRNFIFSIGQVLRYISQVMTLESGDLIATGTPAGVGPLKAGDSIEVEISGIGALRSPVV
jgi:2-keto-4-pentenoate hydratase/2-oxohepta-3-ene-1,7-dioic acid hydratase in catechol pathway